MENIVKFNAVEDNIITIRGEDVILDKDVAMLYDVETKRINEAVKNNPDKFPEGYIIECRRWKRKICGRKFRPQIYLP